ncbi:MAG: A24 family peptidase [Anaerolineae bacterium]|nr:A24 family peptidase [Anaerolineae bacterium]MDW8100195.1 A24 family peptidase [Anaerolineae bacterium]
MSIHAQGGAQLATSVLLIAALLGWGMAYVVNRLADELIGMGRSARPVILACWQHRKHDVRWELRPWLIELGMPLLFAWTAFRFEVTAQAVVIAGYLSVLLLISAVDWATRRIPNVVVLPASAAAVLSAAAGVPPGLWRSLSGGALAFGVFFLAYLLGGLFLRAMGPRAAGGGPALGLGDVKLAMFIGLVTGYPNVMIALLVGTLAGAIAALGQIVWTFIRRRRYQPFTAMAYGPYLALGAAVALLWG